MKASLYLELKVKGKSINVTNLKNREARPGNTRPATYLEPCFSFMP